MEDYKELISLCNYWIGLSDENDKKTMDDQLLNRCKCAIEHLVEINNLLQESIEFISKERIYEKDSCVKCATIANDCIISLQEQLGKVTKERDAMLADLKKYASCECCKYINGYVDDEPCNSCVGGYSRNFEWRGVQE